jgi:DNA-binding NarL/FixJ family response regulator
MNRPRVLLAEDHAGTAARLRKLLGAEFDVVESVADGGALVEAVGRLAPDVIVADIAMPGLDGIAAATIIRRQNSDARIVLVTVHSEPLMVEAGLAAGALGYVFKDTAGEDLVAAVRDALSGRRYVSPALGDLADDTKDETAQLKPNVRK